MSRTILGTSLGISLGLTFASAAMAQPVVPADLRSYSTPQSIGVEWDVTGDEDHDAVVNVRYRAQGASWSDAMPLFRVDFAGNNMLAGSVLFLDGSTDYELDLEMVDPDGGGETRTITVKTLSVPAEPTGGRTFYVVPGSGGGDGSAGDPFQGIGAADAVAEPGDVFLLRSGDYGGQQVHFDTPGTADQYVVWKADEGETPQFNDLRIRGDYIWIEGFDISAPDNAVRNEGPSFGAVVKGNRITGCHYCIHMNDGAESWWISDNVIVGDQEPSSGSFAGEGIELAETPGHTIAYNSISRAADGISYPLHNVDIFGNDIFETSDDGVEMDNGRANVRVWGNRIHHANNNGLTFQPMEGAPWYILRNQVIGSNESVLKVRDAVDRVLLAHNTFVGWTRVFQNSAGWIRNMTVRNNIWITMTGDYIWEDTGSPDITDNWRTTLDYDGFAWPDATTNPIFKWHDVRYDDLAALQAATTIEAHGIRTPMSCFDTLDVPGPSPAVIPPHLVTLAAGCNAIDAGEVLPNINDGYIGAGPDLGAHESGAPALHYGPRGSAGTGGTGGSGGESGSGGATGGSAGASGGGDTGGTGGVSGTGGASASAGANASKSDSNDDGGCGCRSARQGPALPWSAWGLLALVGLGRRRRRSRLGGMC